MINTSPALFKETSDVVSFHLPQELIIGKHEAYQDINIHV